MLSLREKHALSDLLRAAHLAKSTMYYRRARQEVADKYAEVKVLITTFFHQHNGCYGYRRIHCLIRKAGWKLSPKTVRRLMLELRLKSPVRQKKYRSYRGNAGMAAENVLLRDFKAAAPCEKWVTDVTEFNVAGHKLYLSPVLDLFNGEIVAWETSRRPEMLLVSGMLEKAFGRLTGKESLIMHSDQGWQYHMKSYRKALSDKGIRQSMSRKGNCLDNAVMENFFGHLKAEMYYRKRYRTVEELKKDIEKYIIYWNTRRIKLGLGGLSPVAYRTEYQATC